MYCCLCRLCTVHAVGMPAAVGAGDRSWRRVISEKRAFPMSARRRPLRVPWIFVCENNQYATSPSDRAGGGGLHYHSGGRLRVFRAAEIPEWILWWCSPGDRERRR